MVVVVSLRNSVRSKIHEIRYISATELAARWGISRSAVYAGKCGTDKLTPIRFGRSLRFLRAEVEALEKEREKAAMVA